MGKPILILTKVAPDSRSFQLSDLTSRKGTWTELEGDAKTDWAMNLGGVPLQKKAGRHNLAHTVFVASGGAQPTSGNGFGYPTATWIPRDADGNYGATDVGPYELVPYNTTAGVAYTFPNGQINCGLRWVFPAWVEKQRFFFAGVIFTGTWVVTATISDGSSPPATLTLDSNGASWFTLDFRSATAPGAMVTVSITRTVASGGSAGNSVMGPRLVYTTLPEPRPRPRAWTNYLTRMRRLGGSA